jgi:hypothetical protein
MKHTFQTSQSTCVDGSSRPNAQLLGKSPATDCHYQTAAPEFRGGDSSSFEPGKLKAGFRGLTKGLFEAEQRNYRLEGGAFVVIIAIAVWPMVLAAQAAFALIK